MTNLSILEQNIFHAFRGLSDDATAIEEAEAVYLRHVDALGVQVAEKRAHEWLWLAQKTNCYLGMAAKVHGLEAPPNGLREFLRDRWYHYRFPANGNGKTPFARTVS